MGERDYLGGMESQLDLSLPLWDFYRTMGAVLAANLLTVTFVWGLITITKRERDEGIREPANSINPWLAIALPIGFLFAGLIAGGMIL